MAESWSTRRARWLFNWFPAYRGTGGRVEYIADDWTEVRIRVPLNWRTRNVVGTIFGGSLYGALDPIYMLMLIKQLGPEFIVWDKAATIRFRRPGRSTLRATFALPAALVQGIRDEAIANGKTERVLEVELVTETGEVAAACSKTLYVRRRALDPSS
jgi:acyl-coenzyme A thioesterase PaaI-like protein